MKVPNFAVSKSRILTERSSAKGKKKFMNPRLRIEFRTGSCSPLNSSIKQALECWVKCVKHHGRSHLVPKGLEICVNTRDNGCWHWRRIF